MHAHVNVQNVKRFKAKTDLAERPEWEGIMVSSVRVVNSDSKLKSPYVSLVWRESIVIHDFFLDQINQ